MSPEAAGTLAVPVAAPPLAAAAGAAWAVTAGLPGVPVPDCLALCHWAAVTWPLWGPSQKEVPGAVLWGAVTAAVVFLPGALSGLSLVTLAGQ